MTYLPNPDPNAAQHSAALLDIIRKEIANAGGKLNFARYMELALYAPGLGYYSAGSHKLGKSGDFTTAPEISSLFGRCVAKQCQEILKNYSQADILELGAGTGKLAFDMLSELEKLHTLPEHYYILEISAELRERQKQFFTANCPRFLPRIQWLDSLPAKPITGVIIANEVMDAMPVHCFEVTEMGIQERVVAYENGSLVWQKIGANDELNNALHEKLQTDLPYGYQSEINLMLPAWITALAEILQQGVILLFDYGYGESDYYHPDRGCGTLMCYYQHRRHDNPLLLPGLQDITASVDFTTVAASGHQAGLDVLGYTTQAAFLLANGITDLVAEENLDAVRVYEQSQAIKLLTLPAQMGETVKVIGLGKNYPSQPIGFGLFDRRKDL